MREPSATKALIAELDRVDWTGTDACRRAEDALRSAWVALGADLLVDLADYLETLRYPDPAVTRTAELHSWKLSRNPTWDLALNQFLPFADGRTASENIHNHTRELASLCLVGGYRQSYYALTKPCPDYRCGEPFDVLRADDPPGRPGANTIVRHPGHETYAGHVYGITTEVFHALDDFDPGTTTLVVYGPLRQHEIVCFNQISGTVERRRTATDAKARLTAGLRNFARAS